MPLPDRHHRRSAIVAFCLFVVGVALVIFFYGRGWRSHIAASDRPEAPALTETPPHEEPGLMLTFQPLATDGSPVGNATDTRTARLVSLTVPTGTPPTPFLSPGRFRATWAGNLHMNYRDERTFFVEGRGQFTLKINGSVAMSAAGENLSAAPGQKVQLNKGNNAIVAEYESPADGEAVVRLIWSEHPFIHEPVAPTLLNHDGSAPDELIGHRLREGRDLVAGRHCLRCHAPDDSVKAPGAMPDALAAAPTLTDVGTRLNRAWIARWVNDPRSLRPDATMPRLFEATKTADPAEVDVRAGDVAAYLSTLGHQEPSSPAMPDPSAVAAGGKLFASLDCIACHTLPNRPVDRAVDSQRVPLRFVRLKYKATALVEFLRQPEKHYPWIRMPNFRLSETEANALAAYLLSAAPADATTTAPLADGNIERGRQLVSTNGCLNCHAIGDEASSLKVPSLAAIPANDWTRGCMSTDPVAGGAPDFHLAPAQRDAILAFAATDRSSLARESPPEFAERQMAAARCIACHTRDDQPSALSSLQDELRSLPGVESATKPAAPGAIVIDQSPPPLTWVGEKLHEPWMASFIAGKIDYKPRPWLAARMPGFASRADLLAKGLSQEHGTLSEEPPAPPIDPALAQIGRKLCGKNGGFSCVACHSVAGTQSVPVFAAPGIDLMYTNERIRKPYYDRWMRNPERVIHGTKMPSVADEDGKTLITKILGGDANQQFEAIWQYLKQGRQMRPPE